MSKAERDKGRRRELEFAKLIGGERINDEGLPGPDVGGEWGTLYEVKGRASIALHRWFEQAQAEGAEYLATKEDRGLWLVTMTVDRHLADLYGGADV